LCASGKTGDKDVLARHLYLNLRRQASVAKPYAEDDVFVVVPPENTIPKISRYFLHVLARYLPQFLHPHLQDA
jgi:hypothetical protein